MTRKLHHRSVVEWKAGEMPKLGCSCCRVSASFRHPFGQAYCFRKHKSQLFHHSFLTVGQPSMLQSLSVTRTLLSTKHRLLNGSGIPFARRAAKFPSIMHPQRVTRSQASQAATQQRTASVPGLTHSVWGQQQQKPEYPKLTENITADVCVVGAGINGLSLAYNLVREGFGTIPQISPLFGSLAFRFQNKQHVLHIGQWWRFLGVPLLVMFPDSYV